MGKANENGKNHCNRRKPTPLINNTDSHKLIKINNIEITTAVT
jgi:hypothetical protein